MFASIQTKNDKIERAESKIKQLNYFMVQQPATGFLSRNLGQSVCGATPSTFESALNGEVFKPLTVRRQGD